MMPGQPQPTPEEAAMSKTLAQDRPTMDAAVKSYLSLICARGMTLSATDAHAIPQQSTTTVSLSPPAQQETLQVARAILKSINSYEFPIHKTVANAMMEKPGLSAERKQRLFELSIVAQLWNGLVKSAQKPSRFMGRRALRHAWKDLDVVSQLPQEASQEDAAYKRQVEWIQEFERLLFQDKPADESEDDDAALVWDADGGDAELAKRRQRRQTAATARGPVTPS